MNVWISALTWIRDALIGLNEEWPPELLRDGDARFWETAVRLEMSTRGTVSTKTQALIETGAMTAFSPLEAWMFRRRIEWAAQLAVEMSEKQLGMDAPLTDALVWLLVKSWEESGCVGMWYHYERGGAPPPTLE